MLFGALAQEIAVKGEEGEECSGGFVCKDRGKWGSNVLIYFRLFEFLTHLLCILIHIIVCHSSRAMGHNSLT